MPSKEQPVLAMPPKYFTCPACGGKVKAYRNPIPAVDVVIEVSGGIVFIERKNEPSGWALPGGFVEYGETLEQAATREAKEETSLSVKNLRLLGCYSDPHRDPRQHTISTVYTAQAEGVPCAGDDAGHVAIFPLHSLPEPLCFDHRQIMEDYMHQKQMKP